MAEKASRRTVLARLGAPYGVKGWMKLISFTDPPANILNYQRFLVIKEGKQQAVEIDQSRAHGKGFVAHVKGCDDRDKTRIYTGKELLVLAQELPELAPEEYYWHQLEGLTVLNLQQENLGKVSKMLETGANDVLVVSPTEQSIDEEERLIPYLKEQVIKTVNLDAAEIQVDWKKTFLMD